MHSPNEPLSRETLPETLVEAYVLGTLSPEQTSALKSMSDAFPDVAQRMDAARADLLPLRDALAQAHEASDEVVLDDETLALYLDSALDAEERDAVEAKLAGSWNAQKRLTQMVRELGELSRVLNAPAPRMENPLPPESAAPARVQPTLLPPVDAERRIQPRVESSASNTRGMRWTVGIGLGIAFLSLAVLPFGEVPATAALLLGAALVCFAGSEITGLRVSLSTSSRVSRWCASQAAAWAGVSGTLAATSFVAGLISPRPKAYLFVAAGLWVSLCLFFWVIGKSSRENQIEKAYKEECPRPVDDYPKTGGSRPI